MRKIVLFVVLALSTIIVEAQQLRDGHFFKTFNDGQPTAKAWDVVGVTDGTETGIEPLTISPEGEGTEASLREGLVGGSWHTLDGRQLDGKPTTKGMYIHHGKKIVIK